MSYFSKTAATASRSGVPFRVSGPSSSGSEGMGATGLEPVTPSLSSWCSPN